MHELSLCASISHDAVEQTLSVLQGHCAMSSEHTFRRRLIFKSPERPLNLAGVAINKHPSRIKFWKDLQQVLSVQQYFIAAAYDITAYGAPTESTETGGERYVGSP
jgi:hypothetical protein